MNSHGAHPTPSLVSAGPATGGRAGSAASAVAASKLPQGGAVEPRFGGETVGAPAFPPVLSTASLASSDPDPDSPTPPSLFSDQAFAIALNIARMEALNTLYAAATIRDENGNPTREAIFAANRILALSIHHDRRAARIAGAGPSPNLPQGGGGGGAAGGGSRIPTSSSASSSSSPHASPSPSHARPAAPAPASPNLPQGGGGGGAAGGGSCLSSGSSSSSSSSTSPTPAPSELPNPQSEIQSPQSPDDPNDFLALFDSFDDPAEAIASGLNGLMNPEDIVAALARIAANNLAPPPQNRAPP